MQASEVMSTPVITVTPFTAVRDIVAILVEHRIGGVPVVDDGQVVGMIDEGDLLHRHEIGTDRWVGHRSWWQRLAAADPAPAAYVKSHGTRARDVMSRHVTCAGPDTPVARIAGLFEERRIRRVPVVDARRLVGIVTRADLVRALAAQTGPADPAAAPAQTDEAIRVRLLAELEQQPWWQAMWSTVLVDNGVVTYRGVYEREADRQAARVAAENVAGVRAIEDDRVASADWQPML